MKTIKIFIISALTSVLCLGVAYAAYWEQDFTVTSTVDTGKLSIKVDDERAIVPTYVQGEVHRVDKNGKNDDDCQLNDSQNQTFAGNDIHFVIENMYPGSSVVQEFSVDNDGTLGIFLEDITIQALPVDEKNCDYLDIIRSDDDDDDRKGFVDCTCHHLDLNRHMKIEFKLNDSDLGYMSKDEFLKEVGESSQEIKVDEKRYYSIKLTFDEKLSENQLENTKIKYIFSVNYKQFNEMQLQSNIETNASGD